MRTLGCTLVLLLLIASLVRVPPAPVIGQTLQPDPTPRPPSGAELVPVARFPDRPVTDVVITPEGRRFVSLAASQAQPHGGLVELRPDGEPRAYPDAGWNVPPADAGLDPRNHFVDVQAMALDAEGHLWVLDAVAPLTDEPVPGLAKLVKIDLARDKVVDVYALPRETAPAGSHLYDLRLDRRAPLAYVSDAGQSAIILIDLTQRKAHRVLDNHASTAAEEVALNAPAESPPADGDAMPRLGVAALALSPDGEHLYYPPLVGYRLYRIATQALRTLHATPELLAAAVEDLGPDVICTGMMMDDLGQLHLNAPEQRAVVRRTPRGDLATLVQDARLRWPRAITMGPGGELYVTVAEPPHRAADDEAAAVPTPAYAVYRIARRGGG